MTAFLTLAWTFLRSPLGRLIAEIAAGVLIFLAAWGLFAHHYEAKGRAAEHDKTVAALADLATCRDTNRALLTANDQRNAAVAEAKAQGDAINASAAKASTAAQSAALAASKAAEAVLRLPRPSAAVSDPQPCLGLVSAAMSVVRAK